MLKRLLLQKEAKRKRIVKATTANGTDTAEEDTTEAKQAEASAASNEPKQNQPNKENVKTAAPKRSRKAEDLLRKKSTTLKLDK